MLCLLRAASETVEAEEEAATAEAVTAIATE